MRNSQFRRPYLIQNSFIYFRPHKCVEIKIENILLNREIGKIRKYISLEYYFFDIRITFNSYLSFILFDEYLFMNTKYGHTHKNNSMQN